MSTISLANVIRVTILSALRGLANVNTSALALITDDAPLSGTYGTSRVYLDPTGVAQDFGSNTDTARIASVVFAQNPNILTGGGYLVIIPRDQAADATAAVLLSGTLVDFTQLTGTDYSISLGVDGAADADLTIGALDLTSLATIAASLNSTAVSAAGVTVTLSGEITAARVTLTSDTTGALSALIVGTSALGTDIADLIEVTGSAVGSASGLESIKDCIVRVADSVDFFGVVYNVKMTDAQLTDVGILLQGIDKIQFAGSSTFADIAGIFTTIKSASLKNTRCLYYSLSADDAIDFAAGYASRGLSVNFDGSGTVATMHLKDVVGLVGDTGLTQSIIDDCKVAGVDVYADFGVPKTYTSGENTFFDEVYILLAFKLRLLIAGFNFLATTNTKIPQTEDGMNQLKGTYRAVCRQFVNNGAFAPGAWSGSTTFGNPDDHRRNVIDFGYFIYSAPISLQSQTIRAQRIAPIIQIAAKGAGAIHSSDVIVQFEA